MVIAKGVVSGYKEEVVAYYDDKGQSCFINVVDTGTIKEVLAKGKKIYAVKKDDVFPDDFDDYVEEYITNFAEANGYEDIEERLELDSDAFIKVKEAVKEYVKSLGESNYFYEIMDKPMKITIID